MATANTRYLPAGKARKMPVRKVTPYKKPKMPAPQGEMNPRLLEVINRRRSEGPYTGPGLGFERTKDPAKRMQEVSGMDKYMETSKSANLLNQIDKIISEANSISDLNNVDWNELGNLGRDPGDYAEAVNEALGDLYSGGVYAGTGWEDYAKRPGEAFYNDPMQQWQLAVGDESTNVYDRPVDWEGEGGISSDLTTISSNLNSLLSLTGGEPVSLIDATSLGMLSPEEALWVDSMTGKDGIIDMEDIRIISGAVAAGEETGIEDTINEGLGELGETFNSYAAMDTERYNELQELIASMGDSSNSDQMMNLLMAMLSSNQQDEEDRYGLYGVM